MCLFAAQSAHFVPIFIQKCELTLLYYHKFLEIKYLLMKFVSSSNKKYFVFNMINLLISTGLTYCRFWIESTYRQDFCRFFDFRYRLLERILYLCFVIRQRQLQCPVTLRITFNQSQSSVVTGQTVWPRCFCIVATMLSRPEPRI